MADFNSLQKVFNTTDTNICSLGQVTATKDGKEISYKIRAIFSNKVVDSAKLDAIFLENIQTNLQSLVQEIEPSGLSNKIYIVYNYSITAAFKSDIDIAYSNPDPSKPQKDTTKIKDICDEILSHAKACDSKIEDYFDQADLGSLKQSNKEEKITDLINQQKETLKKITDKREKYLQFQKQQTVPFVDNLNPYLSDFLNMIIHMPEVEDSLKNSQHSDDDSLKKEVLKLIRYVKAQTFLYFKFDSCQQTDPSVLENLMKEISASTTNVSSSDNRQSYFQSLIEHLNLTKIISFNTSDKSLYRCKAKTNGNRHLNTIKGNNYINFFQIIQDTTSDKSDNKKLPPNYLIWDSSFDHWLINQNDNSSLNFLQNINEIYNILIECEIIKNIPSSPDELQDLKNKWEQDLKKLSDQNTILKTQIEQNQLLIEEKTLKQKTLNTNSKKIKALQKKITLLETILSNKTSKKIKTKALTEFFESTYAHLKKQSQNHSNMLPPLMSYTEITKKKPVIFAVYKKKIINN